MFIASSVDHLDLAYAAQEGLEHDVEATVWTQGVFALSRSTMASLIDVLDESDFGLFILAPSDISQIKGESRSTVRDNVIFELGLFSGRLGVERCFMIAPRNAEELHFPTDLLGLTPAQYDADRQDGNMVAALGPACNRMRKSIVKLGVLRQATPSPINHATGEDVPAIDGNALCSDRNDCITLIESWFGRRPSAENTRAIRFDDVDKELKLVPGSARQLIEEAAKRWRLEPMRKGQDTITFKTTSIQRTRRSTFSGF